MFLDGKMPVALQQLLFFPLAAPYHAAYHPQLSILRNNNLPRANEDSRTSRRRCPRSRGSRGGAPGPGGDRSHFVFKFLK